MFYNSPKHKHSFCALYRGAGGAGDAVNDSSSEAVITVTARDEAIAAKNAALAAQAAAELAETNAELAETNAELAESNAETAETNAETAASAAASSASAASTSATASANSATAASTSATNAASSASAASASASNSAISASSASTSATNASNSATAAATSADTASTQAINSASGASSAATSAASAATSATNASNSASTATTQAGIATTQASNASSSATAAASSASAASASASAAATSETNASNSASSAATSATNSANSASAAATSATNASTSEIAASVSAANAASSYDDFDDRYLGAKTSDPTVDNDGNPLITGALYFNIGDSLMKVYTGSVWLSAFASLSGALIASNNLSDLADTAAARTNIGLGNVTNESKATMFTSPTFTGTGHFTNGVQIDGDLTVSGTTVTINATDLAIEDNMIYLNNGSAVSNPDLGIAGNYNDGTYRHAGIFRDATDGRWKIYKNYTLEPDASAFIDTSHASFALADMQAENFYGALTGNVTGNVTGDVSGNAGTVTNGVYSSGSYADPSWITSLAETKVLPVQTSNSGKYLSTNGTSTSWQSIPAGYTDTDARAAISSTAPVSYSSSTGVISMAAATSSVNGYLTSTDWNTFNNKQPAGSYVTVGGALGTPSSGTLTNCTGYTYANLSGTVPTWNQNTTGSAATAGYLNNAFAYTNGGDGWFRSAGQAGWFNATYSVGIYATEAGNVRTYNGANFIAAGNLTAYSDERVKTNWRSLPSNFIEQLANLKSGIYDRTDMVATQAGVSAQSLQKFLPEAVVELGDKELSVAYGNAALVAAVELAKQVVELKKEIELLKAK